MVKKTSRRSFLRASSAFVASTSIAAAADPKTPMPEQKQREYQISLAAWSLHRTIGMGEGKVPMLDFPRLAREEFDINGIELVNWMLESSEAAYINAYVKRAEEFDTKILLIMIDREGSIGGESVEEREDAVHRHQKWIDIAADMGCFAVRMNWQGAPRDALTNADALKAFRDRSVVPLRRVCDYGDTKNIHVLIENHGGPSSYPDALEELMLAVDHPRFGTLPDFGNFPKDVDNYEAVDRLMKYAKAVSAKCYAFDADTGLETTLDFERLIATVVDKHKYHDYIGIEFEGRGDEVEGIHACNRLLKKLRAGA